jgi:hypothetical protein
MISHFFYERSGVADINVDVTNHDVDVTANGVEIPTLRPTIDALLVSTKSRRSENVDESTTGSASD